MSTDPLKRFAETPPPLVIGLGVVVVAALGLIDHLTGRAVDIRVLYLAPLVPVAWLAGRPGAIATSLAAAIAVLVADGRIRFDPVLTGWNMVASFGLFLAFGMLVADLHRLRSARQQLRGSDSLTLLSKSGAFYEQASLQVKTAVRYGRPVTLAYIGVDHFNALNERFGHQTGDDVLVSIAQTLRQNLRETDLVARIAGDEFGILFPETDAAAARVAVVKIRDQLADATEGWSLGFSIGAITCDRTSCTLDELIRKAEGLMRSVKLAGRNDIRMDVLEAEAPADGAKT